MTLDVSTSPKESPVVLLSITARKTRHPMALERMAYEDPRGARSSVGMLGEKYIHVVAIEIHTVALKHKHVV